MKKNPSIVTTYQYRIKDSNSEKGNDLTDNKMEQCLEKDLKNKASFTLQDVKGLDNKANNFIKKESPSL